ncbi:MAG TPA: protein phosphatase 2C domain-containing protein [Anaerolineaceae bacterium]|nr:protein phosphatase 2C domain-containing protein [Anaerolineaceae bacterium]HPN50268.1 protein phosphatase 2C domain-containing protein [Anaerolineaceae bacterium]
MNIQAYALTDKGRKRTNNEDAVLFEVRNASEEEVLGLFAVCDGVGGQRCGECASSITIDKLKTELADLFNPPNPYDTRRFPAEGDTQPIEFAQILKKVGAAVQSANQAVVTFAQQNPQKAGDAGTTLTMAFAKGPLVAVANVGDSRTYRLHDHQLIQISHDHSLVRYLVDMGQIRSDQIYTHPQRNVIVRSLGMKEEVDVDVFQVKVEPGDWLFLCSDGYWEMVRDPSSTISIIENAASPQEACQKLVAAANAAGGEDNISVVLARFTEG